IVHVYEPSGNNLSERDIKHGERLQDFCDYHDGLNKWDYIVVDHSGIKCNRHVLLTMALEGKVGKVVIDRKSTRLNSSHVSISYFYIFSLHDALPILIVHVYEPSGNNLSERDIKHGERLQDFCDYHDGLNKWDYIVVDHSGIKCNRHVLLTMALEGKVGKVV